MRLQSAGFKRKKDKNGLFEPLYLWTGEYQNNTSLCYKSVNSLLLIRVVGMNIFNHDRKLHHHKVPFLQVHSNTFQKAFKHFSKAFGSGRCFSKAVPIILLLMHPNALWETSWA
jgi:hypothetical protein